MGGNFKKLKSKIQNESLARKLLRIGDVSCELHAGKGENKGITTPLFALRKAQKKSRYTPKKNASWRRDQKRVDEKKKLHEKL